MSRTTPMLALALLATFAPLATADLLIVDSANGPGTDFADVQSAVDAAQDGDVILVRAHTGVTYGPVKIVAKSLTLVGDPNPALSPFFPNTAANASVESLSISDLPANGRVLVRSMTGTGPAGLSLLVSDCEGAVFVDRCVFQATGFPTIVVPTALVSRSQSVSITGTSIGGQQGFTGFAGWAATFQDSDVYLASGSISGGLGVSAQMLPGGAINASPGNTGLIVSGGHVRASGMFILGGNGGAGMMDPQGACWSPAPGGVALSMFDGLTPSHVELLGTTLDGGNGGGIPSAGVGCTPASEGSDLEFFSGTLTKDSSLKARALVTPPTVREGEIASLRFQGPATDVAILMIGPPSRAIVDPLFFLGPLFTDSIDYVEIIGITGLGGQIVRSFLVPDLGPGVEAVPAFMQGAFFSSAGELVMGDPTLTLLLDSSL